jgi:hypothetical protein
MKTAGVIVMIGCVLAGCSANRAVVSTSDDVQYQITLEREILVGITDSNSDSQAPQKQTESLELVCRLQSVPGEMNCYRVTFEQVTVHRSDFLDQLSMEDPVGELAGKTFDVHVDSDGRIVKADAMEKEFQSLAKGCTTCPQGDDCAKRKLRDQTFLLDVWASQQLLFRVFKASRNVAELNQWQYQLPSVLPGESPFVTTAGWKTDTSRPDTLIINGFETLSVEPSKDVLPALFHPHVRPKGLLGHLRNCTYDSIDGNVALTVQSVSGVPLQVTRETAMDASAIYPLSRQPQKATIKIFETTKITKL